MAYSRWAGAGSVSSVVNEDAWEGRPRESTEIVIDLLPNDISLPEVFAVYPAPAYVRRWFTETVVSQRNWLWGVSQQQFSNDARSQHKPMYASSGAGLAGIVRDLDRAAVRAHHSLRNEVQRGGSWEGYWDLSGQA